MFAIYRVAGAALFTFFAASSVHSQTEACNAVDGAIVLNSDGEFIGTISDASNSDSIFNEYGEYGSEYRSGSIWNEYGKNGSEYRTGSAFNEYTRNPPKIVKSRKVVGYLSVNKYLTGAINPTVLGAICYGFKPPR